MAPDAVAILTPFDLLFSDRLPANLVASFDEWNSPLVAICF